MIPSGEDGYYHPSNEAEICELVKHAADNGLRVRVRGSSHSVPPAIYTSPPEVDPHSYHTWPPDDGNINIYRYSSGIAAQQKTDETLTEIKRESNTLLVYSTHYDIKWP